MPARRRPDPEDVDSGVEAEPVAPRHRTRPTPRRHRPAERTARASPQPWSMRGDDPEEEASAEATETEDDEPGFFHRTKRPVFYRARDAWWFEPLIALMIIVVLLAGLYAYTQNWPPMYVVESSSMQHGTNDVVGLINTGDLVLAQQTSTSSIVPYIVGMQTGYRTYGEFGDVLLYHPNGDTAPAPIIHRAILYLAYNANGSFDAPQLGGLPCGQAADRAYLASTTDGCGTIGLRGTLELFQIGWQSVSVNITLSDLGHHSGFLTMGDNNINPGTQTGDQDQPGLSTLVSPSWVIGVARGMIPWVGALKLLLGGDSTEVPSQSWAFLGISVAGIFLLGALIHFGLRAEGVEDERRKALEEEDADAEAEHASRFGGLRGWFSRSSDDEGEDDSSGDSAGDADTRRHGRPKPGRALRIGGRPRPTVRRSESRTKGGKRSRPPGGEAGEL